MNLPDLEYLRPETVGQACHMLGRFPEKAVLLAGGTDLLVRLKQRLATPSYLVGTSHLPLDYIYPADGMLRLGALTPIHAIETSKELTGWFSPLREAASRIASPQIRHRATLSGNLCLDTRCRFLNHSDLWRESRGPCYKTGGKSCHAVKGGKRCFALFCADLPVVLTAMGASIKLRRWRGQRHIPVADLYSGDGASPFTLPAGEMITEVEIPGPQPRSGLSFLKHSIRHAVDFGILSVAASVRLGGDGTCTSARMVVGCIASAPISLHQAIAPLLGKRIDSGTSRLVAESASRLPLAPVALDVSPAYVRRAMAVLAPRAVMQAAAAAESAQGTQGTQ